ASVQTVLPLGNGTGIKLTTARYYTPKGRSIQNKGITPDIVVEEGKVTGADNDPNLNIREVDLDRHLNNPQTTTSKPAAAPAVIITPEKPAGPVKPEKLEPGEVVSKNDFQFSQALSLLKGLNIIQSHEKQAK
ncbi:MAG: S41 family peptidase, partial [Sulfuriferula sp.]